MKKGVLKTLLFYGIGFSIAVIVSLIVNKQQYNAPLHGPVLELKHGIVFLTFLIGQIWALISFFRFLRKPTENLKGIFITNWLLIFFLLIFLFIAMR